MRQIPPLTALRAFEAAARHLSFKDAADELFVTPAAISLQIQKLEEHLKATLFRRFNRRVELTDAGAKYLSRMRVVFDDIEEASRDIVQQGEGEVLSLAIPPMLLNRWMIPRLAGFQAQYPELKLRFLDTLRYVDFDKEPVDASIRYGFGGWENVHEEYLFPEELCPVCSPDLLAKHPLNGPEDLANVHLIYTERRLVQWDNYLAASGYQHIEAKGRLFFLSSMQTTQAVIAGLGVALANRRFVAADIQAGRLVIPFELETQFARQPGYYLVAPERHFKRPAVQHFRDWLVNPAQTEPTSEP